MNQVINIEKYIDDELDRLFLQVQLKEITLCETCDTIFKYVPQKRFCDACRKKKRTAQRRAYGQRPEVKERKREYDREYGREYRQRPEVKERRRKKALKN